MSTADMVGVFRPGELEAVMPIAPLFSCEWLDDAVHRTHEQPEAGFAILNLRCYAS